MLRKITGIFSILVISTLLTLSVIADKLPLAPNFILDDLRAKKVSLNDFKNKIIILDFWATWCPPCREEIPGFIELHKKYKTKNVVIIGVSMDKNKEKVIAFAKEFKINYPLLLGNAKVASDYGPIRAIPTTFIINAKGQIYKKFIGYQEKEVFEKEIIGLLRSRVKS